MVPQVAVELQQTAGTRICPNATFSLSVCIMRVKFLATRAAIILCLLGALAGQAQEVVKVTTNYYTIRASTIGELRAALDEGRPWKNHEQVDARTEWNIQWSYRIERSEEHTSELQSHSFISYAVFCLK